MNVFTWRDGKPVVTGDTVHYFESVHGIPKDVFIDMLKEDWTNSTFEERQAWLTGSYAQYTDTHNHV